jgi:hypothetical protein
MTFEEIREMLDATINENGQRQITGKALNLAFVETLNAVQQYLEENKPEVGGAASEIAYFPDMNTSEMDPEHQAHNLEIYNKFKAAFDGGEPLPLLSMDLSIMFAGIEEQLGQPVNASGYSPCMMVVFVPADSPLVAEMGEGIVFMVDMGGSTIHGVVQPDGSTLLMS